MSATVLLRGFDAKRVAVDIWTYRCVHAFCADEDFVVVAISDGEHDDVSVTMRVEVARVLLGQLAKEMVQVEATVAALLPIVPKGEATA